MSTRYSQPDGKIAYSGSTLSATSLNDAIDQINGSNGVVALSVYDSTGGQTFTTTPINHNTPNVAYTSGDFTVGVNSVTFLEAGLYQITVDVSTDIQSGNVRSTSQAYVQSDTGSGFITIPGTTGFMYNRTLNAAANSCSISFTRDIQANEVLRVQLVRFTGSDTLTTLANGFRFNAIKLTAQGPSGPQGIAGPSGDINWLGDWNSSTAYAVNDTVQYMGSSYRANSPNSNDAPPSVNWDLVAEKGDAGAGSSIDVQQGVVTVTNSPFNTIRFNDQHFSATDLGSGVVQVSNTPSSGTIMPSSPVAGQLFYRTDHNWLYQYDATRGKWLSVSTEFEGAGVNGSQGNGYLKRFNGAVMSATLGTYIPFDITIVAMSYKSDTSITNGTLNLDRDGISVSSIPILSSNLASSDVLNDDFDAGGTMAFRFSGMTASVTTPQVRVWYRRRTT